MARKLIYPPPFVGSGFAFVDGAARSSIYDFKIFGKVAILRPDVSLSAPLKAGGLVQIGTGPAAVARFYSLLVWRSRGLCVLVYADTDGSVRVLNTTSETVPSGKILSGAITYLLK